MTQPISSLGVAGGVCQYHIVSTAAPCFQVVSTPPGASPCPGNPKWRHRAQGALRARNVWRSALGQSQRRVLCPTGRGRMTWEFRCLMINWALIKTYHHLGIPLTLHSICPVILPSPSRFHFALPGFFFKVSPEVYSLQEIIPGFLPYRAEPKML